MEKNPVQVLGLPDPGTLVLEDSALLSAYRDFYGKLSLSSEGDVVVCTASFFSFYTPGGGIAPEHLPRLKLLHALMRPTKGALRKMTKRTHAVHDFNVRRGRFQGHVHHFSIAQAVKECARFQASADYHALTKGALPCQTLESLRSVFSNAPGMQWSAELVVDKWSEDWAIMLYYGDAEEDPSAAFPEVVGFAQTANDHAVCKLISEQPTYRISSGAEVYGTGKSSLSAYWTCDDEEDDEYYEEDDGHDDEFEELTDPSS